MQFILKENSFERRYTDYAATIDSEKIRGFDLLTLLSQRETERCIHMQTIYSFLDDFL